MNSFQHVWSQVSCSAELNLPREQVLRAQGLLNEKCRGRVWRHSPLSCAVTRSPESCATRDTVRQEVNPRRRNLTRNPPRIPFPREAVSCRLHVSALSPSTASPPPPLNSPHSTRASVRPRRPQTFPELSSFHPNLVDHGGSPTPRKISSLKIFSPLQQLIILPARVRPILDLVAPP